MRYLGIFAAIAVCLAVAGTAGAVEVTFSFNPNDWMNSYSTDITKTRLQQDNPRLLIDGVAQATDTVAGTHTTYAGASYSSTGIAGYQNQAPSVVLHDFNMWLADGINAPNWGEVLTQVQGTLPSGTGGNGWAAVVIDNPWPQSGVGSKLIQWYDVGYWDNGTAGNPLVFGDTSFGNFTFTADINLLDVYGNAVDLSVGTTQRVWLGTMLPLEWTTNWQNLVYANNHRFEGLTEMTVTGPAQQEPIPEPVTMAGVLMGIGGLVGYARKRRKA